jgi:hypothetical protein
MFWHRTRRVVQPGSGPISGPESATSAPTPPANRRAVLTLGTAAVAVVAHAALKREPAEAHGVEHRTSTTAAPAFHGDNTVSSGMGVLGTGVGFGVTGIGGHTGVTGRSAEGIGVAGSAGGAAIPGRPNIGVIGVSRRGVGVEGTAYVSGWGVNGHSEDGIGVVGTAGLGVGELRGVGVSGHGAHIGVNGESASGVGVRGQSYHVAVYGEGLAEGVGVDGTGSTGVRGTGRAIGVVASSPTGIALDVQGLARFLTARSATIPAGTAETTVVDPQATKFSHLTITLTSNPGGESGRPITLQWVERLPGKFIVHLTSAVRTDTPFTYLIVEPA